MKKGKTLFLIIYLVFHLILLVASIVVNIRADDFEFLFSVRDNMAATVWFGVVGLLLFIANVIIISVSNRNHEKQEESLRQEINSLKAKIYDLQDAKGITGGTVTPTTPDNKTDKPSPGQPSKE